jgi:hypothetical protein
VTFIVVGITCDSGISEEVCKQCFLQQQDVTLQKVSSFFLCDAIMMTLMSSHQILDKHTMVDDTDVISPNP